MRVGSGPINVPSTSPASASEIGGRVVGSVTALDVEGWTGWGLEVWLSLRAYAGLGKPGIIWLLLVTTVPAMILAHGSWPALDLVALTLLGGILTSGGANAMNQWFDRDIDGVMQRTRGRPIPQGRIAPGRALLFGLTLAALGGLELGLAVNALSAALALGAAMFYVTVYTVWLKRSSTQNIVIGGAAGAIPPMVGWAAVTGGVGLPALYMFAIIFFWTPPHFWALALLIKDDYTSAGVPMLPVVAGVDETKRSIFLYSLLLLALTTMFFTTSAVGWLYLGGASGLGLGFVWHAWRLMRQPGIAAARTTYLYSLAYLGIVFLIIVIDSVVAR